MKYFFPLAVLIGATFAQTTEPCSPLPPSTGPVPNPNTLDAFRSSDEYDNQANGAATPAGYQQVLTDSDGAIIALNSYITYFDLSSYSPQECADNCASVNGCQAFNVYFERDPSVEPGDDCPNPPANILAKCALFSQPVQDFQATNYGQIRGPPDDNGDSFIVAIRGSNAYNAGTTNPPVTVTSTTTTTIATSNPSVPTVTVTSTSTTTVTTTTTLTATGGTTLATCPTTTAVQAGETTTVVVVFTSTETVTQ
ncbi:Nn.00g104320.m01.CDS01 [Neocucurbitaria sp. VM-36]